MYTFNRGQETNYCYLSNVESIHYTCHLTAFLIYHCCGCGSYIFPLKARHALLFCLLQCGCVPRRIVSLVFYLGCNHDYVLITLGKDSQLLKVQEEKLFLNFLNFWEISTLLQNRLREMFPKSLGKGSPKRWTTIPMRLGKDRIFTKGLIAIGHFVRF